MRKKDTTEGNQKAIESAPPLDEGVDTADALNGTVRGSQAVDVDKPTRRGRKPGVPNKITQSVKELILKKGKPVELLCAVSRGTRIRVGPQAGPGKPEYVYPSLKDRVEAATILLRKVAPDLRSQEISGPDGGPIETKAGDGSLNPMAELARRFAFVMASGEAATAEPERPTKAARPQPTPVTVEEPKAAPPVDPTRLPENNRRDNRVIPLDAGRPQVLTKRRY